jgi:hypothetical protein
LRNPGAVEGCNGTDDDCDAAADEAPAQSTCPSSNALGQVCQAGACRITACPSGTYDCNGIPERRLRARGRHHALRRLQHELRGAPS